MEEALVAAEAAFEVVHQEDFREEDALLVDFLEEVHQEEAFQEDLDIAQVQGFILDQVIMADMEVAVAAVEELRQ